MRQVYLRKPWLCICCVMLMKFYCCTLIYTSTINIHSCGYIINYLLGDDFVDDKILTREKFKKFVFCSMDEGSCFSTFPTPQSLSWKLWFSCSNTFIWMDLFLKLANAIEAIVPPTPLGGRLYGRFFGMDLPWQLRAILDVPLMSSKNTSSTWAKLC